MEYPALQASIDDLGLSSSPVAWSICIRTPSADIVAQHNATRSLRTASIGKLLLLAEVARQLDSGDLAEDALLTRTPELEVADSGLWQHLRADSLSVTDLAVLVAAVSDNLATNVLLDHVGLDNVTRLTHKLRLTNTALLDYVRNERTPIDPPTLSVGSAAALSQLMVQMSAEDLVSASVSRRMSDWLLLGTDLSMVAGAFGLDPLAHLAPDRGFLVCNKTGTDAGVRADVGLVSTGIETLAYAAIANWPDEQGPIRDDVLSTMQRIGAALRNCLASS